MTVTRELVPVVRPPVRRSSSLTLGGDSLRAAVTVAASARSEARARRGVAVQLRQSALALRKAASNLRQAAVSTRSAPLHEWRAALGVPLTRSVSSDTAQRNQVARLVEENLVLADRLARRISPQGYLNEDFQQVARLALA